MSNVVRLRASQHDVWGPVFSDIIDALYRRGDFRLIAQFTESFGRDSLRLGRTDGIAARAAARMGEFSRALEFAARMRETGDPAWEAVEGYTRARAGFEASGEALLRRACASEDPHVRAEGGFRLALLQWNRGAVDDAEATTQLYLASETPNERSLFNEMRGWIEVARGRYAQAGPHFRAALEAHELSGLCDEWKRQRLLQSLTIVALETLDFGLLRGLEILEADLGEQALEPACYATQNRGWLALLAGHQIEALDLFQRARALASTPALVGMTEVNLATYHRLRGSNVCAADHLAVAREHFRRQDWKKANVDERVGLLEYAIEAYQLDRFSAGEMLTRYMSTALRRFVTLSFEGDRRTAALELTARGVLEAIHGRVDSATRDLAAAVVAWHALGYGLREVTAALLLHSVSGDPKHLDVARRITRRVPRSWLAHEVARRGQSGPSIPLSRRPEGRARARAPRVDPPSVRA